MYVCMHVCPYMIIVCPSMLRMAAHSHANFLLTVATLDYYYCILTGASPLQHKYKVLAEGAAL